MRSWSEASLEPVHNCRRVKEFTHPIPTNHLSRIHVKTSEVTGCHHSEMPTERIYPDITGELGVADGDVAAHAFSKPFPGKVTEDGCRMD